MMLAPEEVRRLAAKFCRMTPEQVEAMADKFTVAGQPVEKTPKHWPKVRAILKAGPSSYRKVARILRITSHHASTLLGRLAMRGLIEVDTPGRSSGNHAFATIYRLKTQPKNT